MEEPPVDLLEMLPSAAQSAVAKWWSALSDEERRELRGLWDDRLEAKFFVPQSNDDWDNIPSVVGGKFVPHDDARGFSEWGESHFEFLLDHPEIVLAYEKPRRTFYIGGFTMIPAENRLPNS